MKTLINQILNNLRSSVTSIFENSTERTEIKSSEGTEENSSERIERLYLDANRNFRFNRYPEALEQYEQVLRLQPDFPNAYYIYYRLGGIHEEEKRFEDAAKHYEQSLRLKGNYTEARRALTDVNKYTSKGNQAMECYVLANKNYNDGNCSEALVQYEKMFGYQPDYAWGNFKHEDYYKLAFVYHQNNRYKEAIGHYHKFIALKPDFAEAYYHLALAQISAAGGLVGHKQAFAQYRTLKTINLELASKLFDIISNPSYELSGENPGSAEGFYIQGRFRFNKGDYEKAAADFEQAIRLKPDFTEAFNSLGQVYEAQKRFAEANEQYQRAVNLDEAVARLELGITYCNDERYDEAVEELEKALDLNPNLESAHFTLGKIYCQRGDMESDYKAEAKLKILKKLKSSMHYELYLLYREKFD